LAPPQPATKPLPPSKRFGPKPATLCARPDSGGRASFAALEKKRLSSHGPHSRCAHAGWGSIIHYVEIVGGFRPIFYGNLDQVLHGEMSQRSKIVMSNHVCMTDALAIFSIADRLERFSLGSTAPNDQNKFSAVDRWKQFRLFNQHFSPTSAQYDTPMGAAKHSETSHEMQKSWKLTLGFYQSLAGRGISGICASSPKGSCFTRPFWAWPHTFSTLSFSPAAGKRTGTSSAESLAK
jgi:hypothetical protein